LLKYILVIASLILLSSVIIGTKVILFSLNYNKVNIKAESGSKKSIFIKKILDNQNRFLAISSIFVFVIGAILGGYVTDSLWQLFILLVPISVINFAFIKLFTLIINPLIKSDDNFDEHVTEEEIRMMLDVPLESTDLDEEERQMINNIFEFDDKTVEEICTHRTDIVAINIEDDIIDILKEISEIKYSRIPAYEDNIDNIIGVLNIKDIMKYLLASMTISIEDDFNLRDVLWEAYFVPPSKKTDELFKEMKKTKNHIAIVVDEYGGTVGIVTMEDLVEEIVGSISDEYDDDEVPDFSEITDGIYEVSGAASLEELAEKLNISLPVDEYDTVGGFIVSLLGRIPAEDEKPEIEFSGFVFKVTEVEDKRISYILINKKG